MPSWKKVIVSGSQAHLQGITASNLTNNTNTPTSQIVGYNSTTGILSYFNTSSIVVATASYALTASFINPTGTNAFVQGGNSFGATAVLGTNDNNSLIFETNGTQKAIIAPSGYTKFNYATNDGTQAFGVLNTNISESFALSGYNIWSGSNNNDVVTGQFVYTGDNYNNDNIRQTLILGQPALGIVAGVATRPSRIAIIANTTHEPNTIGFNSASIDFIIGSKNTGRMLQIKSGSVGIGMGATELADNTIRLRLRGSGTTSTTTALRVENSSTAASLVVRDDGTVGIGTSTPTNTLQVSGSLWATTITASNIPSAPNANFLLYNSQSGEFTYQSTSSIGNVQGTGTNTHITYWTGTNTVAGNYRFTFNPTGGPAGAARVLVSGELVAGYLRAETKLTSELDTELSGSVKLGNNINDTVTVNSQTVTLQNPLLSTANVADVLVLTSSNRIATQSIDTRVFGTTLIDGTLTANRVPFASDPNTLTDDANFTYNSGTDVLTINSSTFGQSVSVNQNLTVGGNATITGDLTVNGDTTIINTSTLSVEDKFIVLGRSSGSQVPASEGGIIVEGAAGSGSAFVFNSGSGGANGLANRWGVALGVGTASINVTPTNFMVTVSSSAAAPSDANPPTFGSSSFGYGNMHINTNGEIWIYS